MDRALSQRPGGPGANPIYSSFFCEGFSNCEITYERPKSRKGNKKDQRLRILEDGSTQTKTKLELEKLIHCNNDCIVPLLIKRLPNKIKEHLFEAATLKKYIFKTSTRYLKNTII